MNVPPLRPTRKTFAEAYCEQHHISREKFDHRVLKETLHSSAKLFYPIIRLFAPHYFQADLDLIRATGRLRRARDYATEVTEFLHHPANSGFWRSSMGLRISTGRLRRLLRRTLYTTQSSTGSEESNEQEKQANSETALPFEIVPARKKRSEQHLEA